jgi:hypothetical protein
VLLCEREWFVDSAGACVAWVDHCERRVPSCLHTKKLAVNKDNNNNSGMYVQYETQRYAVLVISLVLFTRQQITKSNYQQYVSRTQKQHNEFSFSKY